LEGIQKKWALGIIAGNIYKIDKNINLLSTNNKDKLPRLANSLIKIILWFLRMKLLLMQKNGGK
jgi:hypothetical protein